MVDGNEDLNTIINYSIDNSIAIDDPIISEKIKELPDLSSHNIKIITCDKKNVTEGIGDHYKIEELHYYETNPDIDGKWEINFDTYGKWEPMQPIFISAQTGSGKNYFIENSLIPYIRDLNYENNTKHKMLIISNRLALKQQIDNHINGKNDLDEINERIYPYKGFADVITYQGILKQKDKFIRKQKSKKIYLYVICDEAHFFTSDAMFNPDTGKILSTIVSVFHNAIRVYMTATPYDCFEYIKDTEEWEYKVRNRNQDPDDFMSIAFYYFERDFNYLTVKAYSNIEDLYDQIITSVNKGKKWLIFIDNKNKCASVKKQLEEYGNKYNCPMVVDKSKKDKSGKSESEKDTPEKLDKIFVVDATSKNDEEYISILKKEKLNKNTHVLISTSVLDNGINLTGIDNIVVSDISKTKCLQMVGRARVKNNEPKTLYIKNFNAKEIKDRINSLENQKNAYYNYGRAFDAKDRSDTYYFYNKYYRGDSKDWDNAKRLFNISREEPFKLYLNEIAKSLIDKEISIYKSILNEDEQNQGEVETLKSVEQRCSEYQFSWFRKEYCIDNDITLCKKKSLINKLLEFLESYVGKEIDKESQKEFRAEFTRRHDAIFPKNNYNGLDYGIDVINKLLKKHNLGFKLEGQMNSNVPWKVIKIEERTEPTE